MEIQEIGRMIYTLRKEKSISQDELCHGLCSVATLSRLESGERRPDILVFNAILQRLGKSADYVNILYTLEEFEYFVKRRNVEIALMIKDYEQAEKDLDLFTRELEEGGETVQRQDIYRLYAILCIQKENDYKKAKEYLYKALLETIPELEDKNQFATSEIQNVWLSEVELQLLLLYVYVKECLGIDEEILLEGILGYIRLKITDEMAQNKALAQGLHVQAYLYKKRQEWEKCYKCCEAIIEAEIKNGTIAILYQALEMEMECLKNGVVTQNGKLRQKEYQCLKEVMEEYGQENCHNTYGLFWNITSQEKGLIDEIVYCSRMREGYSQEELGDGICSSETISRIELGKNNPTIKKFYAIMEKLGLGIGYYNTEFNVERFETLQKIEKLNRLNMFKKHEEAEELLKEIESEIEIEKNRQQLGLYHIVFDYRLGRISVEEALERTKELLEETVEKIDGDYKVPVFLSSIEISLFNQIAVYYRIMGRTPEAVKLLKTLYKYFHKSKIEAPEQSKKYFMLVNNLAIYLEEIDELEESIEYSNEALSLNVRYNLGVRIGRNLIAKAYTQERMGKDKCLNDYKNGYYLCRLFGDFCNQTIVKNHVLEKWNIKYGD